MEKTLYLKDENGDVFAVLNGAKRRETLLSVRERLGCKRKFAFLLYGIPLKAKQESKTLVEDCCLADKQVDENFELNIKILDTQSPSAKQHETSDVATSFIHETETSNETIKAATIEGRVFSSNHETENTEKEPNDFPLYRNKPSHASDLRKVHLIKAYTKDEITLTTEFLAKEKMRFHNSMINKLENDRSLDGWMLQELLGVIESSWVMKRTELLKLKVKELVTKEMDLSDSARGKAIMRNLEEVEKAHFDVNREYVKFAAEVEKNKEKRQSLENKFDEFFSVLKQSQGKLKKAIIESALPLKSSQTAPSGLNLQEQNVSSVPSALGCDEVSSLVKDIKTEYESD